MHPIARSALAALLLAALTACQPTKAPFETTLVFSSGLMGGIEPCDCPTSPMGGVARQATLLRQVRGSGRPMLLFDAGDTLLGTEQSDADHGKTMIEAMNRLGYDAMSLGEQDRLSPAELAARAALARFPVLGRGGPFEHVVLERGGHRYGVVSIDRSPGESLSVALMRARLQALWLRGRVEVLVGLGHLVELDDVAIARKLPEFHVLYNGHPHGMGLMTQVGGTLVVHAYPLGGKGMSALELAFDPGQGRVTRSRLERLGMSPRVPDDPAMRAWLSGRSLPKVATKPWPNLPITTVNGQPVFPSTWKGRPGVMLVACWCMPCQQAARDLEALQHDQPARSAHILSLLPARGTAYQVKRLHLTLPVFADPDGKGYQLLGKPACPHLYLLNAKGRIEGEVTREELAKRPLRDTVQAL